VWTNDGNGTFTNTQTLDGGLNSSGVALGDVDGDGDLDAFVANYNSQPNIVWLNVPPQRWYLSKVSLDTWKFMYRDDTGKDSDTEEVAAGNSQYWMLYEPAGGDITFTAGTWTGNLEFSAAPPSGDFATVWVGHYDGVDWTAVSSQTLNQSGSDTNFAINIAASEFTVYDGDYLAMRFKNDHGSESVTLKLGSDFSYISSPASDPGYPVPELPTVILVGSALAALTAFIVLRRRRDRNRASQPLW
jgi:hypothetical protein